MKRYVGLLIAGVLVAIAPGFTVVAPSVLAAGEVLESTPADGAQLDGVPAAVEVTFDESFDVEAVQLVVIAPNGARADVGQSSTNANGARSVALRAGLGDGRYLVYWLSGPGGKRATGFGDFAFEVNGSSRCQPESNATPRPPAESCVADPPESIPGEAIETNGISVKLEISSNQAGPVDMTATVTDADGGPRDDATVWFRARHLEMDHGELPYLAASNGDGVYSAGRVGMGMGGAWRVAVDVVLPGQEPITVFFAQQIEE